MYNGLNVKPNLSTIPLKEFYMGGSIKAAKRSVCNKCGGTKFKRVYNDLIQVTIPVCACGGRPLKYMVTKYEPVGQVDYYSLNGNPITTISQAMAVIEGVNKEISTGSYIPEKHLPKSKELFKFKNFVNLYIENLEWRRKTFMPGDGKKKYIAPGSINQMKQILLNTCVPFFKETLIQDITDSMLEDFDASIKNDNNGERAPHKRRNALITLRAMFYFAMKKKKFILSIPTFPTIGIARKLREEEVSDVETRAKIIMGITEERLRTIWILGACIADRPCEATAHKVKDVNVFKKTIKTQGHFSQGGTGIGEVWQSGRKCIGPNEKGGIVEHALDDFLITILLPYLKDKGPEEYIFNGAQSDHVNQTILTKAWYRSQKRLGLRFRPYTAMRHTTLTEIFKKTGSWERVQQFSFHQNVAQLRDYVIPKCEDNRPLLDTESFRVQTGCGVKWKTKKNKEVK